MFQRNKTIKQAQNYMPSVAQLQSMSLDVPSVAVPSDQSESDWIAFHVFEFLKYVKELRHLIEPDCKCQKMTCAGMEFMWQDGKIAQSVSALEYFDKLEAWIYELGGDTKLFPIDGGKYPYDFAKRMSQVYRRMLRTFAHAYLNHQGYLVEQGLELICLSKLKHFYMFATKFGLCSQKDFQMLQSVVTKI